jgi:hypothetical protein
VPEKRNTAILAHEVATALRMGGNVVLTVNGPAIIMPQGAHEAEHGAREAEQGEESQGEDLGPRRRKEVEALVEEWTQENRAQGPAAVMYAVSGKQRIFRNR